MPIETTDVLPFVKWFPGALVYWAVTIGCLLAAGVFIGWLVSALRRGPMSAFVVVGRTLQAGVVDMVRISPRRVLALAWLAVKESIRRRVIVVFAIFLVVMLFGSWFLNPATDQPARLYIEVVLTTTRYLVLLLALFLSAMSIPLDIKNRTLFTLVTKPVRQSELVLGRILGFVVIGTILLAVMGVISYVFTIRSLSHTHVLTAADLREEPAVAGQRPSRRGLTEEANHHRHEVRIDPSGKIDIETKQNHWHEVTVEGEGPDARYTLGPPQGMLVARVPLYGKLNFKDRKGNDAEKGVNVGDEWTYRSFIEGGSRAAANWTFEGVTEAMFPESEYPDAIPLEMTIEVFRTHKGDLEKAIAGSLAVRNPDTEKTVEVRVFSAKKFATDLQWIPRTLTQRRSDGTTETLDLFRDLVTPDGRLEVVVQCLERGQYFGMAQADVYLRARYASFALNFAKGYLGIWIQMALITGFGVMFSTFLSAPVAILATLGAFIGGLFVQEMGEIATGKALGGGPFEAMLRIVNQQNIISEMEPGLKTNVAQMSDHLIESLLWVISAILPDLGRFDFTNNVSYGFDVGPDLLLRSLGRAAAFLIPLLVAGYFFLKTREVAK